jgi:hypothetical protein
LPELITGHVGERRTSGACTNDASRLHPPHELTGPRRA